jgi:anaerobic carbon-monoxide dehydrogenase iron sulfur subunit
MVQQRQSGCGKSLLGEVVRFDRLIIIQEMRMTGLISLVVKQQECSGCLSCCTTCSLYKEQYISLAVSRVRVELRLFGGNHKISLCRQCRKAHCVDVCSRDAIQISPFGAWVIDYNLCDSCQECMTACPFDAIFWDPINLRVIKCELCGGTPQCSQACPTGAIKSVVKGSRREEK